MKAIESIKACASDSDSTNAHLLNELENIADVYVKEMSRRPEILADVIKFVSDLFEKYSEEDEQIMVMATIELYSNGKVISTKQLTDEEWSAIKYLDYLDTDELQQFIHVHGEEITKRMLSYFGINHIKFQYSK